MRKYLKALLWISLATLIAAGAGASVETNVGAADQGPTLVVTQKWFIDHQNDFTSSFSFSNASLHSFVLTIQKVGLVIKPYNPKNTPFPGCLIHFYGKARVEAYDTDNSYETVASFRAEDVSDVVEIRKLAPKDLGPDVQDFNGHDCYCLVITPKDPNSGALEMTGFGVPYLQPQELHYIAIPVADQAMAERLAKALHHGIQLIQAQAAAAAKPEAF